MIQVSHGYSRTVILTRRRAYKLPSFRSWKGALWGVLSNLKERERSGAPGLCPVLWSLPGGLMIVMPRCGRPPLDLLPSPGSAALDDPDAYKACSYGLLDGQLVRVDYHGACAPREAA